MLVKNIFIQSSNHPKGGQLAKVKECRSRQTASQEVDDTSWCVLVEPEETSEGLLVVLVDHCDLWVSEDKRTEARHQDRDGVQLVNVQAGCRVSAVTLSHTSVQDPRESFPMSFEALKDSWFITRDTSQHAHVFSRR